MLGAQDLQHAVRTALNSDNVHLLVVDFTMVLRSIAQNSTDAVLLAGLVQRNRGDRYPALVQVAKCQPARAWKLT